VVTDEAGNIGIVFDDENRWLHAFIVTKRDAGT
jgi:hypothetical protein